MKSTNIPEVKLGLIAVSRDCFPIELSQKRRAAVAAACAAKGVDIYEAKTTVENEKDMLAAVKEVTEAGCNALTVFLGNFGPETPETLIAKYFDGPCMFVAAAEGDGDLINGRGDAYCGMLNCSYNLGMRHLNGYIPEYPIGTAEELADKMAEFVPMARAIIGVKNLKIITFGPRPQDFFACNAPIMGLYKLGVCLISVNPQLNCALNSSHVCRVGHSGAAHNQGCRCRRGRGFMDISMFSLFLHQSIYLQRLHSEGSHFVKNFFILFFVRHDSSSLNTSRRKLRPLDNRIFTLPSVIRRIRAVSFMERSS